jgi:hypothetical protein
MGFRISQTFQEHFLKTFVGYVGVYNFSIRYTNPCGGSQQIF